MTKKKITSVDVARHAGVSQSAVSRVFTPNASVSSATRQKVLDSAKALGYRINPIARAMITGKSKIIGLVVAYLDNQFYPVALERFSRKLQEQGYHILVFMLDQQSNELHDIVQELLDYRVDGIIAASVSMSNELAAECQVAGIPVMLFNRGQDDVRLGSVTSDNLAGGRTVADFLVAGGHQRIVHIAGWQESSTGRERATGFVDGLAVHGIKPVAVVDGMYDRTIAGKLTHELFNQPKSRRPDAVFVGNDHMAFAVMDVLRYELGLSVPDDVSVVGYDDVPIAAWPSYSLTTISQSVDDMVETTITALLSRIEGDSEAQKIQIPGQLILRSSARQPLVDISK